MTLRRGLLTAGFTVCAAMLGWLMFVGLPRWYGPGAPAAALPTAAATPGEAARKIKARLFYVGADGTRLSAVERDVAYAERPADQAREIINAQIAPAADPLVSAIPPATKLRALFVTQNGEAFVDLSGDVQSAHPGGSLNELLTVYTIVDALTANLPAITAVQVLVDGKEVETLAGHVDLRRPLAKNLTWIEEETRTP
jgi:spore germination protein GerM